MLIKWCNNMCAFFSVLCETAISAHRNEQDKEFAAFFIIPSFPCMWSADCMIPCKSFSLVSAVSRTYHHSCAPTRSSQVKRDPMTS